MPPSLEQKLQRALKTGRLLDKLNNRGLERYAREMNTSKGALYYWLLKLGVEKRWIKVDRR
ncbi:MAG: hypothetical protein ABIH46_05705 [Chloroflexota bacterium]